MEWDAQGTETKCGASSESLIAVRRSDNCRGTAERDCIVATDIPPEARADSRL